MCCRLAVPMSAAKVYGPKPKKTLYYLVLYAQERSGDSDERFQQAIARHGSNSRSQSLTWILFAKGFWPVAHTRMISTASFACPARCAASAT